MSSAIAALHDIGYTGTVKDERIFPSRPTKKLFRQVSYNIRISIAISKTFRIDNGLPPLGGSYSLMVSYWQASADLRRKNLAEFIIPKFRDDFRKTFGQPITPRLTDPISHPPAAPYRQINLAGTIEEAQTIVGLNADEVANFVKNYVDDYNYAKGGGGQSHADAMEDTQDMVSCFRAAR